MSAALTAVTSQEPAAVGERVVPETVQSPESLVKVTGPVPDPPDVASVRFASNVALVVEMENDAWVAREISKLWD